MNCLACRQAEWLKETELIIVINRGTSFEEVKTVYVCPVCGTLKVEVD